MINRRNLQAKAHFLKIQKKCRVRVRVRVRVKVRVRVRVRVRVSVRVRVRWGIPLRKIPAHSLSLS